MLLQGTGSGTAQADPTPRPGPVKGIGIRLIEAPVVRRKDPRARVAVVDYLPPGATIKRRFAVSNTTDKRQHVELYAAAADIVKDVFDFADDRAQNELSKWITVTPDSVDLPPRSTTTSRFTIAVPKTAWKGERYAVIWAQVAAPPDAHHNLGMVRRVGIRVYLGVGPGGEPPSDLRVDKLTPERLPDGRPRVTVQIHNTGGRALDIAGLLALSHGPGGPRAGTYASDTTVALKPDETGQEVFTLDKRLPNGPWDVDLDVTSGAVKRHVSTKVTFPAKGVGMSVSAFSAIRLPLATAVIALTISLAAGAVYLRRRRRRSCSDEG